MLLFQIVFSNPDIFHNSTHLLITFGHTAGRQSVGSCSFYGMPDHRLPVLRSDLAGIGEINLMVQARCREIIQIAILRQILVHECDGCRLIVVRADVHDLHAKTFVNRQELRLGAIYLFLFGCGLDRPVKIGLGGNPADG